MRTGGFYASGKGGLVAVTGITAKAEVTSKVKGLKDGAEDYIVKPFEMLEVMVRLEKVLDRYGTAPKQIQIDDVIIDTVSHIVTKNVEESLTRVLEIFHYLDGLYQKASDVTDSEGDDVTNDIFVGAKAELEKNIWMVAAVLGQEPGL